jgi:DNA repair protein RadC
MFVNEDPMVQRYYKIPVYRVAMIKENTISVEQKIIHSPRDVFDAVHEYLADVDREHFLTLFLNTKNGIIGVNTTSIGTLNSSLVYPREVFKPAIIANSAAIILVHCHPSGNPDPSNEDLEITRRLVEAGKLLGIEVLDHVIVGDGCWVSLKEKGIL